MTGVPLPPHPPRGPGGRRPFGRGSGDGVPRRPATSASGKGATSGASSTGNSGSTNSRRFTQSTSSSSQSASADRTGGTTRGPGTNQLGQTQVRIEDWPKIPNQQAAGKASVSLPREFGTYSPSPEVIRTGSWPYNYVNGGASPARIGGSTSGLSGRGVTSMNTTSSMSGAMNGARSGPSNISNQGRNFPSSAQTPNAAGPGEKYFGSARSTLGARVSSATFGTNQSASSVQLKGNIQGNVNVGTSYTSTTNNVYSSTSTTTMSVSTNRGVQSSGNYQKTADVRQLKPQGRITGRGARRPTTKVRVEDLGLNPLGPLPTLTILGGAPLVYSAVKQSPRMGVERKGDCSLHTPAYSDRGAAAAAAAAAGSALQAVAGAATVAGLYAAEKAREDVKKRAQERKLAKAVRDQERAKEVVMEQERERKREKERARAGGGTNARSPKKSDSKSGEKFAVNFAKDGAGDAKQSERAIKQAEAARTKAKLELENKKTAQRELEQRRREEAAAQKARVKFEIQEKEKKIKEEKLRVAQREERAKKQAAEKLQKEKAKAEKALAAEKKSSRQSSRQATPVCTPRGQDTPFASPLPSPRVLLDKAKEQVSNVVASLPSTPRGDRSPLGTPRSTQNSPMKTPPRTPRTPRGGGKTPVKDSKSNPTSPHPLTPVLDQAQKQSLKLQKLKEKKDAKRAEKIARKKAEKKAEAKASGSAGKK